MSSDSTHPTLADICIDISYGYTESASSEEVGPKFLRITDIQGGTIDWDRVPFCPASPQDVQKYRLEVGDIVAARTGNSTGENAQIFSPPPSAVYASYLIRFRPDGKRVNPFYVGYQLRSERFRQHVLSVRGGSAQPGANAKQLGAFPLLLIDRSQQDAVVSTLRALDNRITLLRETNATLEAIAQALFKSWFVDFDPVRAKMEGRVPEGMDETTAALFPDGLEDSELGLVPKGWKNRTMSDVSTVGIGKTPPRKEQHWFSEDPRDVRWVSIRDMGAVGVYANQTSEFLTKDAVERFNVRRVPDNTVLMSFKMTIGRVAIADGEMTTNEAIAHFKLMPEAPLSPEFIYLHLKQFDYSTLSSTSSIADAVNSKTVREIPILVPSSEIMAIFQTQVGVLFEKLKNTEQQAQTLATLRDTLLPRLISGQLRLPEAQAAAAEALA